MSEKKSSPAKKKPAPAAKKATKPKAQARPQKPELSEEEALRLAEGKPLTDSEELFAQAYLAKDLNATEAYLVVHPNVKRTTAAVEGCKRLGKPNVARRVAELKAERAKRLELDGDALLRDIHAIATADHRELTEYFRTCCRYCWGEGYGYQRTAGEMERDRQKHEEAEEEKQLKAELRNKAYTSKPFDEKGGTGYDARRDPNPECPECFGWGVGRTIIKDTRRLSPAGVVLFAGVEETKDGIRVRAHDKGAAQDKLARHLGLYEADNAQQAAGGETRSKEELDDLYATARANAEAMRDMMAERRKQIEAEDAASRQVGGASAAAPGAAT